jgi:hypothetical protein
VQYLTRKAEYLDCAAVSRRFFLATLLVGSVALIGCGDDEGSPTGERDAATAALLAKSDLPADAEVQTSLPELCGPLPTLKKHGGDTAISKLFAFAGFRVEEAIGSFRSERNAAAAYDELIASSRNKCIRDAISSITQRPVEVASERSLGVGDEDEFVRYLASDSGAAQGNYAEEITIRAGRCVASLMVVAEEADLDSPTPRQIGDRAGRRLASGCP